jgi:hypothetical protein
MAWAPMPQISIQSIERIESITVGAQREARRRDFTIAEHTYWVSRSFYPPYGLIVNRRRAEHDQGDGLTFADDWHEGRA